jgi:hypothetical protein
MNTHFVLAALAATLCGLPAAAQNPNCPRERAVPVPGRVITGATHDCGGVSIAIQGVQIHHPSQGCPLFVIYEPPHSVAGPSGRDTQVQVAQLLDVVKMTFECKRNWFLFIPLDSSCRCAGSTTVKAIPFLITVPCVEKPVE